MSPKLSRSFASLAILFSFAAATALPQCESQFQYSSGYRVSILDLSIDNNDLWAASGYGVQLYDRSADPPRLAGSIGIPGITSVVRGSNGIAYAGGTAGIAVVRHSGRSLQLVRMIAPGLINDLALLPTELFAATPAGIVAFDLTDPQNPARSPATFPTSSPAVSSLAIAGTTLYAADGDGTLEVFAVGSGTSPVKLGTITTLARATSLESIGSRLYVSDGINTDVLSGTGANLTSLGILPFPARSAADAGSNILFVAGAGRQLRAVDASVPQNYVELFDDELPPSGGTINRVTAVKTAAGRLYAGGGDSGLTTYDISQFGAPFALRAYAIGATSSVVALSNAFYASLPAGGIQELNRSSSGGLVLARTWDKTEISIVQDGSGDLLLTSSGASLTLWYLRSTIPTSQSAATFGRPIQKAYFSGTSRATVLLDDGTIWTADLSQPAPAPVHVAGTYSQLLDLAVSDRGTAATEVSVGAVSTTVHFWSGDLNATPADVVVPGVATALALNGATAAVFTYQGIKIIDFAASMQDIVPGSNSAILKDLVLSGGKAIGLTQTGAIRVWDMASGRLEKQLTIPGSAGGISGLSGSTVVAASTSLGVASIDYGVTTSQPVVLGRSGRNEYYRKAVAAKSHLYLFDGGVVDIFNIASTNAPMWTGSVFAPGTLDIAASDSALFTLSSAGVISEYSPDGVQIRTTPLGEGNDVTPLAIASAGGAAWVSFSRGCTTGVCEKRTDVFDPQSLVRTASLAGGTIDVKTSGSRAYAIFDLPAEIRVYDIGDPLHPAPLATTPNDIGAVSIGSSAGTVYALGSKIYAYAEGTLTRTGEFLSPQTPSTSAALLIDGGCATISGRSSSAERYTLPAWTAASPIPVPGNIRSMPFASGRLMIMTDYSVEIWSRTAPPVPAKRRGVR